MADKSMIRGFLQETYIDTANIRKHAEVPAAAEGPAPALLKV